ncbi:MAG: hypothetical protein HY002_03635 [Candidatus Rokubacteria bacterium]|nr:hypothetical protein [Candidatus Rokubacteria bacterium]
MRSDAILWRMFVVLWLDALVSFWLGWTEGTEWSVEGILGTVTFLGVLAFIGSWLLAAWILYVAEVEPGRRGVRLFTDLDD